MTLGLTAVMTAISAMHQKAARALLRFRKSGAAGQHDLFGNAELHLAFGPTSSSELGHGAVQRVVVGPFVHMLARYSQRGSRRRQTGAIVCRLRVRTAGLSASIIVRLKNGPSVSFFPLWPPFYDSRDPGQALIGSVRPCWASLRPDGVRTVPTARGRISRGRKGVNNQLTTQLTGWFFLLTVTTRYCF